ncbi:MAG TPA: glycosyl hydrolase [Kofleriaceae bacterium]
MTLLAESRNAFAITDGNYTIHTAVSGKCLEVPGSNTADGAPLQEWSCNDTQAQIFEVTQLGGGFYKLVNVNSKKSLDIRNASTQENAPLQQWGYGGGENQQFQIVDRGGGKFSLHPRHTGMALDVFFGRADDGTPIVQYPWSGRNNQLWTFQRRDIIPPPAVFCKRGIASNVAPGAAFFPAVAWWYNWSFQPEGTNVGISFVPMIWGRDFLGKAIPADSKFLLGFNEPNFHEQSNLTAKDAAARWPSVQAQARTTGAAIVSPAVNFCAPAARCNGTDPYQYLKDFFAACQGCKVDYIAVHWYNCDLPSLRDYLEPGGPLQGFEQFGKPIWLTEFSCERDASIAEQERFMRAAIPYLESNPHVFRYSWFSADPIPNARLVNSNGSPTALGRVYINLPRNCP